MSTIICVFSVGNPIFFSYFFPRILLSLYQEEQLSIISKKTTKLAVSFSVSALDKSSGGDIFLPCINAYQQLLCPL